MRYLTLALVAVFGIVTSNADAQCIGCGHHVGGAPITCDYNYLWDNFSPTQCRYEPRPGMPCGGCRLGCGKLLGQFAGACRSKTSGCCNDNCCSTPSPNIGWDGWGHGLGGAGLGGYGGYSLASWHGLGGGGHRLMTGGCNRSCGAGGCAPGCHNFNVGWLGSLMERLRNCCGTRAMSHGSLDRCGLTSSSWASYPAGNLDVSFGKGNGCYGGTSNGQHDGGEGAQQPSNELQPAPVPEDLPTAYQRQESNPNDVNRLHGSRFEDSVPLPPVTGTDAKLKLNQVSLNR